MALCVEIVSISTHVCRPSFTETVKALSSFPAEVLGNLDLFFQRFAGSVTLNCKIQLAGTINSGSSRKLSVAVYKMQMMKWFTLGMQPVLLLNHLHTVDALPVDLSRWIQSSVLLSFPSFLLLSNRYDNDFISWFPSSKGF